MEPRRKEPSQAVEATKYLGVGLTWAASTALFLYLGSLADGWLGTDPWLTVIGAFVGGAAGFYHMYRQLVIVPTRRRKEKEPPR
jgi:F0F1-type ATP synthase assembly protein I